ncbi:MAG: hypothetical protein GC182_20840 [Rhodopseudomonas sp.]|nr:hypothetical protein [Rhodopseudomonas sp.]
MIVEAADAGTTAREYAGFDDMPLAVVADVSTMTPNLYFVHADHLNRPFMMTHGAKNVVWSATYWPFGEVSSISGSASNNLRFPGQYFQIESGLHYNWYRQYDPTLGRYTQPDPLGFVDGPSIYAYARSGPTQYVDPDGRFLPVLLGVAGGLLLEFAADYIEQHNCSCGGDGSSTVNYAVAAATGGILGDVADPLPYPGTGLGGASEITSRLSSSLSRALPSLGRNVWAPTLLRPFGASANLGRIIGRWSPVLAFGYAAYDVYRIGRCLSQ